MRHLVTTCETWDALGIVFVSIKEGVDYGTPSGRLFVHMLGALAMFERERLKERMLASITRRRAAGEPIGRPRHRLSAAQLARVEGLSVRAAGALLGVSRSTVHRSRLSQKVA